MAKTYMQECYDLAVLFLSDSPDLDTEANRDELASHFQTEGEDRVEYLFKPRATESFLEKTEAKQIGRDALRAAGLPHS